MLLLILVWQVGLPRMHGPATMRVDGLTAHVGGRQGQTYTGRHAGTVDAEIDGRHSDEPGLAWNAEQAGGLGGQSAGAFKARCRNVPLGLGPRSLADSDRTFWRRTAAHRRTTIASIGTSPVTTAAAAASVAVVVVIVVSRAFSACGIAIIAIAVPSVRVAVSAIAAIPAITRAPAASVVVVFSPSAATVVVFVTVGSLAITVVAVRFVRIPIALVAVVGVASFPRARGGAAVFFIGVSAGSTVSPVPIAVVIPIAVRCRRAVAVLVLSANFPVNARQEGVGRVSHDGSAPCQNGSCDVTVARRREELVDVRRATTAADAWTRKRMQPEPHTKFHFPLWLPVSSHLPKSAKLGVARVRALKRCREACGWEFHIALVGRAAPLPPTLQHRQQRPIICCPGPAPERIDAVSHVESCRSMDRAPHAPGSALLVPHHRAALRLGEAVRAQDAPRACTRSHAMEGV